MKITENQPKANSLVKSKKEFILLPSDKLTAILRDECEDVLSIHASSKVFARVTIEVFDTDAVASLLKPF